MTLAELIALAEFGQTLVQAGMVTVKQIREALGHHNLTEEQMATVLHWVQDDAARRKARADLDAGDAPE